MIIDPELLFEDDPLEVLKPLAHENRHDVQNRIIEEYRQQAETADPDAEVRIWDDAKTNYTTRKPKRYHYNALEVDAREAETELERGYLRRDNEYLSGAEAARPRTRLAARGRRPHRRDLGRWGRERDL